MAALKVMQLKSLVTVRLNYLKVNLACHLGEDSEAYQKLCKEVEVSIVARLGLVPRLTVEDAGEVLQQLLSSILKEPSFSTMQAVEDFPD